MPEQMADRKHILITGVSGFVGTSLVNYLQKKIQGVSIIGASRRKKSISHFYPILKQCVSNAEIFDMPVRAYSYVHLSGKVYDVRDKNNEEEYYKANYEATKELFNHFIKDPEAKKFLFLSTIHVLTESPDTVLDEAYNPEPFTPYGKSKYLAEKYIQQNCPPDKDYYILRPSMIHGPGNKGNLNLLYSLIDKGIPYPIGAINNKRSFVSIENLCFTIHELIFGNVKKGLYHIADDDATFTHDLVKLIANVTNQKPRMLNIPPCLLRGMARLGDYIPLIPLNTHRLNKLTGDFVVSNKKLKKEIGKPFPVKSEEGLKFTLGNLYD